ncbi:cytochrome P450 26A1-like [Elysia marginata]|uniref:Cytochrome P450 26A1-like n=1 Tax=Elysia marginata TaxID=1093978 RepID=A0AAV4F6W2_9GAST|nr:cytochrome P450 26A1-like [Elysia marginata]
MFAAEYPSSIVPASETKGEFHFQCVWSDSLTDVSPTTSVLSTLACGLLTLFLSTVLWRRYYESCRDSSSNLPLPRGSFGYPLVGETIHFIVEGMTQFVKNRRRKEGINKTHLLGSPMVTVDSDQRIQQLVSKEPHALVSSLPTSTRVIFGENGISVVTGKEHASMKKSMKQAFTPVRLSDYLPIVQKCIRRHIVSWIEENTGNKLLGFKVCEKLVCDLILETVVGCGRDQDPDGKVRDAFVVCNENLFCVPLAIPGTAFYKVKQARQVVVDFVKKHLATADSSSKDFVTILDVLLAHQRKPEGTSLANGKDEGQDDVLDRSDQLSDIQLIDNAVSLMIAGLDTVTSSFCSILSLLGKHPDKLAALRQELESQDLLNNDLDDDLTYELIQSLPYVQAINKEVLRFFPPVGGLLRVSKKTLEFEDFQIPANWRVQYSVRGVHEVTKAFDDKQEFLPERWLDPKLEERLRTEFPCGYAPFGIGSRACLGKDLALLEMSVFVIEVARLTDWSLLNPNAKQVFLPIEKPFDNLPMTVSKRK